MTDKGESALERLIRKADEAEKAHNNGRELVWEKGDTKTTFLKRHAECKAAWGDVFLINVTDMPKGIFIWWLQRKRKGGA